MSPSPACYRELAQLRLTAMVKLPGLRLASRLCHQNFEFLILGDCFVPDELQRGPGWDQLPSLFEANPLVFADVNN